MQVQEINPFFLPQSANHKTKSMYPPSGGVSETHTVQKENILGKDDFLRLLTTQLEYQDPLKPMNNEEFIAQTAQFSALEEMRNLNQKIEDLTALFSSVDNSMATNLIGKNVLAQNSSFIYDGNSSISLRYILAKASAIKVEIRDENGSLVRTIEEQFKAEGKNEIFWDGKDDKGKKVPTGRYNYNVFPLETPDLSLGLKDNVTAFGVIEGRVTGVIFEGNQMLLSIGGQKVPRADVLAIGERNSE